jgi:hypothetical protein
MGTSLTGLEIRDTYDSLIKVTDNGPLSGTAKYLSDGLGNDSALALSTTAVGIGTATPASLLTIQPANDAADTLRIYRGKDGGFEAQSAIIDAQNGNANFKLLAADAVRYFSFQLSSNSGSSYTEAMRITSAGNVGIGATPSAWASGYKVLQGSFVTSYGYDQNVPANLIVSNAYNDGTWKYGINAPAARLNVVGWTGVHTFEVAASGTAGAAITWLERARIDNDGLKFNGDTAAANALDDYEEGTWTISVSFGGASVGVTYNANTGAYTKIGRQVTVNGFLNLSSKGSSTGSALITGLPFTIANSATTYTASSFRINEITFANQFQGFGDPNTTNIVLEEVSEAGVKTSITDADFANTSDIMFSSHLLRIKNKTKQND